MLFALSGLAAGVLLYHVIATRSGWSKLTALLGLLGFAALLGVLNSLATYLGSLLATE